MNSIVCKVCETTMKRSELPKFEIYHCDNCNEIGQMVNGEIASIGTLLEKNSYGDERVLYATSKPHVATVRSFVDVFEGVSRFLQMDLAEASGGLRVVLRMTENRIDSALNCFTGLDLGSEEAAKGLLALREARELVSTSNRAMRGLKE